MVRLLGINNYNAMTQRKVQKENVAFGASSEPLYAVKNSNPIKRILPAVAFAGSIVSALGYLIGGSALFYDLYAERHNKPSEDFKKEKKKEEGAKTIVPNTKVAQIGMNCTKIGLAASSVAGIACGLGEGVPLMALGDSATLGAAKSIETPTGTGLFGIGIASIFAGLALDNTPALKLNEFKLMSAKGIANKAKLVAKNILEASKEVSSSIFEIGKNIFDIKWLKENIFQGTPNNCVFTESINKNGKAFLQKGLRHNKNYLMHAASFILAVGGVGIIAASKLNMKKTQKNSLRVEEGGFLFDNFGITRYGWDKATTGSRYTGSSFVIGGVINAISQFMGLDNKDGRAMQWVGIALVYLGYSLDRGKMLGKKLAEAKMRPELKHAIREWKIDLKKIVSSNDELNSLKRTLKDESKIKNTNFRKLRIAIKKTIKDVYKENETIRFATSQSMLESVKQKLSALYGNDAGAKLAESISVNPYGEENAVKIIDGKKISLFDKTEDMLKECTVRIFGSLNPAKLEQTK